MTLEELKIEADKLGYSVVKKQSYIKLLPCICGNKRPTRQTLCGIKGGSQGYYQCKKCGLNSGIASKFIKQQRIDWNDTIKEIGIKSN